MVDNTTGECADDFSMLREIEQDATREKYNLQKRFAAYNAFMNDDRLKGTIKGIQISQKVSNRARTKVLMPPQIRTLAYLLGFEDPASSFYMTPVGVTDKIYYRQILPEIPKTCEILCSSLNMHLKKYGNVAYTKKGVKIAFKRLSEKGELNYTPKRFNEAFSMIGL